MSLEAALNENTATMKQLIAVLEASNASRAEALAKIETLPAADKATRARTTKTETAAASPPPPPPPPAAPKTISGEDLLAKFGEYLGVDDAAEREKRKEFVKALLNEIGVSRASEIAEEDRPRALDLLTRKIKGENVNFGADPAPEDDLL